MNEPTPATLDEIRRLIAELPAADLEAGTAAVERQRRLLKPPGALGRLEELVEWLARWQGRHPPRLDRPRICVFAGSHGVAGRGVSAYPPEVTAQMVQAFLDGHAAINQLARLIDADLRVFELALEDPTADFTEAPAMAESEGAHAMSYGMMAVEPGLDLLCLGEMGIGNTTAAAALAHAMHGGRAGDWTGRGTGVDDRTLARKVDAVATAVARHRDRAADGLDLLCRLGGRELAAIAGAILAARLARTPVVLDGYAATAAAAALHACDRRALDHCLVGHVSAEPGHRRLLDAIGKRPLLDLDMRLGEASGAATAVSLLRAALACHEGMATFDDAGVSGPADPR